MLYVDQHGSFFNVFDENPIGLDVNCISIQMGFFFLYIIIKITISSIVIGLKKFVLGQFSEPITLKVVV